MMRTFEKNVRSLLHQNDETLLLFTFSSGNQTSLFGSSSRGSAGLNRAMRRVSNTGAPISIHIMDSSYRSGTRYGRQATLGTQLAMNFQPNCSFWLAPELKRHGHHRHGSVQNAITSRFEGREGNNVSSEKLYILQYRPGGEIIEMDPGWWQSPYSAWESFRQRRRNRYRQEDQDFVLDEHGTGDRSTSRRIFSG